MTRNRSFTISEAPPPSQDMPVDSTANRHCGRLSAGSHLTRPAYPHHDQHFQLAARPPGGGTFSVVSFHIALQSRLLKAPGSLPGQASATPLAESAGQPSAPQCARSQAGALILCQWHDALASRVKVVSESRVRVQCCHLAHTARQRPAVSSGSVPGAR
jgi:hypothetical protein